MAASKLPIGSADVAHLFRQSISHGLKDVGLLSPAGLQASRAKLVGDGLMFASHGSLYFAPSFGESGYKYGESTELPASKDSFTSPPMQLEDSLVSFAVGDGSKREAEVCSVAGKPYGKGFLYCKGHADGKVSVGFASVTHRETVPSGIEVLWEAAAFVPEVRCQGWCGVDVAIRQ